MKRFCLFALFLGLYPLAAYSQSADVSGVVQDSSGSAIAKASIEFRNQDTGIRQATTTNENGFYHIPSIQPGKYDASVQATGFQTLTREGIVFQTDTTRRVDFSLKVGSSNSTVTVTADNGLLQQNNDQVETHISESDYNNLPLLQLGRNRSPASFMYLAPGVQGNIALNGTEYTGATNVLSVNGSQAYSTEILVEGFPGGQARISGNFTESSPPPDAISEFKVTTTGLPAEYGHTGAAVGSFTIKSGKNDLHGSVYEYFRNSAMDANNWLAKHNNARITSSKLNEFGATIGGPVVLPRLYNGHDKTFFFFSYGGSRLAGPNSFTQTQIPTLDQRQGRFTFTGNATANAGLYDPATTRPSRTTFLRDKFPVVSSTATTTTYQIPASRFDTVAQNVLKLYPNPNQSGTANYGAWGGNPLLNPNLYTAKVDHLLTSNQHLSAIYIRTIVPRTTLSGVIGAGPLSNSSYQVVASHTGRLNHIWTISPSILNAASFGFNRFTNSNLPLYQNSGYPEQIGFQTPSYYFLTFTFSNGYTSVASTANGLNVENDFYYKDQMTWQVRNHTITFGGEYRKFQYNDTSPYKFSGSFGFNSLEIGNPTLQSATGDGFAAFLLGQVDSGTVNQPVTVNARKSYWGFFIEDDYHVNTRLTLNLGIRDEWQPPAIEAHDRMSAVSLTTPNPTAGNFPGALVFAGSRPVGVGSQNLYPGNHSSIGPRAGFAFSVTPQTVLRAAYGVFYSDANYNGYTSVISSGFQVTGSFVSPDNGVNSAFILANGVPKTYPTVANPSPGFVNGQGASYYENYMAAMPRLQDWNINVQQQLTKNSSITLLYMGNRGTRQINPYAINVNQVDPKYLALGSLLTQPATSAAAVQAGVAVPFPGFTGSVAQALRPFPQYLTLNAVAAKRGSSEYNAGQVIYEGKTAWGLMFHAGYTYAKNMGYANSDLDGSGGTNNMLQNSYNLRSEWSLLPQDVRHSLVMFYSYALPTGPGKKYLTHGFGGKLGGGWMISGIQSYQGGSPLGIYMTNSLPLFNRILRPSIVANVSHSLSGTCDPNTSCIVNKVAFTTPANYAFGNSKPTYSDLRNYGVFSENISLTKEMQFGEHLHWSLYGQALNLFNRHRFAGINTNFSSASFGAPSTVSNPRQIQLGTRIQF